MDMVAQPHTSMTLGYHMDGASLRGRFIFTAWVGKRSTGKGCQRRKPKARSTESVYRGRFHHTAAAWKDKFWARTAIARAVAKLVDTRSVLLVSIPPFPVQVCGSSRRAVALHPPSCSLGPRAQPRGSAARAQGQLSCGAAVWPWIWLLGKSCVGKSWEKPHRETLLFPWEPPLSSGPQSWSLHELHSSCASAWPRTSPVWTLTPHWPGCCLISPGLSGRRWYPGCSSSPAFRTLHLQGLQDCALVGGIPPCPPCRHHRFPHRLPAGSSPPLLLPDTLQLSAVAAGIAKLGLFFTGLNPLDLGTCFWCMVTRREPLYVH